MNARFSPRVALLVIAALFVLPIVLAWLMYTGAIEFRPGSTRNLGQLVEPPLPLPWDGVYVDGAADVAAADAFAGHWLILHVVPRPCPEACLRAIAELRQVHRAAGRQQERIRLALLHDVGEPESAARLQQIYAPFRLLENPDGRLWRTLETVAGKAEPPAPARGSNYLIDPLGNIMMFYAAGSDPNDLNKDLKRLLAWSKLDEQR
jgi:cytochrome oxidase Cu insertion factor (SCO1/SenC/PrrC family)